MRSLAAKPTSLRLTARRSFTGWRAVTRSARCSSDRARGSRSERVHGRRAMCAFATSPPGGHGRAVGEPLGRPVAGPPRAWSAARSTSAGFRNITVLEQGRGPVAFDIGSADALMDAAVDWLAERERTLLLRRPRARWRRDVHGDCSNPSRRPLLRRPAPPKSTGKENFHLDVPSSELVGSARSPPTTYWRRSRRSPPRRWRAPLEQFDVTELCRRRRGDAESGPGGRHCSAASARGGDRAD